MHTDYSTYIKRRGLLTEAIRKAHPSKKGVVLLLAAFENRHYAFRQDSSFYYFTGINEPGVALLIDDKKTTLYVPHYGSPRTHWATSIVDDSNEQLQKYGIDDKQNLGQTFKGYSFPAVGVPAEYEHLLALLEKRVAADEVVFTLYSEKNFTEQSLVLDRLLLSKPQLKKALVDITPLVAAMRRTKSQSELELIYAAIDCTMQAHDAAAGRIEPDMYEYQVQAAIEFIFKESGGSPSFPTIVASGRNSTILHSHDNRRQMQKGELVVVDIGAEIDHYCADLTRTYPVSGVFTNRQRDVYNIVLQTQQYLEALAKPGYYLSNKEYPELSLNHLARAYLKEQGYENYFNHGIGHLHGT